MFTQQRAPTRSASASCALQRARPAARMASSRLSGLACQAPTSAIEMPGRRRRGRVGVDLVQRRVVGQRPVRGAEAALAQQRDPARRASRSVFGSGEARRTIRTHRPICCRAWSAMEERALRFARLAGPGWRSRRCASAARRSGNTPLPYTQDVPLEDALATVRRVFEGPINFLDTSNNYGDAEAAHRHRHPRARRHARGLRARDQGRPRHGHRRLLR